MFNSHTMRFYIFTVIFCCFMMSLYQIRTGTHYELSNIIYNNTDGKIPNVPLPYKQTTKKDKISGECVYPELFEIDKFSKTCTKKKPGVCEGGNLFKFKHHWACTDCPEGSYPSNYNTYDKSSIPVCKKYDSIVLRDTSQNDRLHESSLPVHMIDVNNEKIISREYAAIAGKSLLASVKNPCKYDILTGAIVDDAELVVSPGGVVTCINTDSSVVTVISERDYLMNNNGSYANGVIRISNKPADFSIVEFNENTRHPSRVGYAYLWDNILPWIKNTFSITKPDGSDHVYIFNAISPEGTINDPVNDFLNIWTLYMEKATSLSPKPGTNTFYGSHTIMNGGQVYPLIHCWDLGTERVDASDDQGLSTDHSMFSHERDDLRKSGYAVCVDHEGLKINVDYRHLSGVIVFNGNTIDSGWFGTQAQRDRYTALMRYSQ